MRQRDLERIAALLDRRLPQAERDAVLDELGTDPELYEVYAEAVRLREADRAGAAAAEEEPASRGSAVMRWPRPGRAPWLGLVAAAGLAAVAGLVVWSGSGQDPLELAEAIGANGLPAGDWSRPLWPVVRGEGDAESVRRASFRLGVRAVDLVAAVSGGDEPVADEMLREMRALLQELPAGQPAILLLDALGDGAEIVAVRALVRRTLTAYAQRTAYELGQWCEAARLAIEVGDEVRVGAPPRMSEVIPTDTARELDEIVERLRSQPGPDVAARLANLIARF